MERKTTTKEAPMDFVGSCCMLKNELLEEEETKAKPATKYGGWLYIYESNLLLQPLMKGYGITVHAFGNSNKDGIEDLTHSVTNNQIGNRLLTSPKKTFTE